jgi:acetyl esterase/lipase
MRIRSLAVGHRALGVKRRDPWHFMPDRADFPAPGRIERRDPLVMHPAGSLVAALLLAASSALAADPSPQLPHYPPPHRIATPAEPGAIRLYQGAAPGSEGAAQSEIWDEIMGERVVRNVTQPTLTPFLPPADKATGTAVIVAPGGAYLMLSMDNEGYPVARALVAHGVAAFVLKYRLDPTPADEHEFEALAKARFGGAAKAGADKVAPIKQPLAVKDAVAALAYVRGHAAEWHIDPQRVGVLGFSAGAMTALEATLQNDAPRPDFAGLIYGPMTPVTAPGPLPPLFIALAANDPLFGRSGFGIIDSWRQAGGPVELHLYEKGDHGFGMRHQGTTSDHWLEQYLQWLQARGLLKVQHSP